MTTTTNNHRINYIEFPVRDITKAKEFFGAAFGWSFQDFGDQYSSFHDGAMDGGFRRQAEPVPAGDGVLVVLYADDLEESRSRVIKAGGEISVDIFSFPGGRRFQFREPNGNELAVWSDKG